MEKLKKPENPIFSKTQEYLKMKHQELKNDYMSEDGGPEACLLVAVDVAKLILEEGGKPELFAIRGKKVDSVNTKSISPTQYDGRVEWGGHMVCVNDGIVYDPMVGNPTELSEYLETSFLEPVEATVRISKERIDDFVK